MTDIKLEDILDPEIKEFLEQKITKKRGYKYCVCGEYIPARLKTCPHCDKDFITGEKNEPPRVLTQEEQEQKDYLVKMGYNGRGITFPAGKCPIPLNLPEIKKWIDLIIDYGRENKCIYFPSAIKYWLREFVDVNSKEYVTYSKIIDETLK